MRENWFGRDPQVATAFLSAELRQLDPVEVNFGGWLQLQGVRVVPDAGGINLRLRWRALRQAPYPLRCFVHVLDGGRQITSLDHQILHGRPAITSWTEGDEGYEQLRLWHAAPAPDWKLRLGVYDPDINVRCPVLASTLPVVDESSAVLVEPRATAGTEYFVKFDAAPLQPCQVVFQGGFEITAYSVTRYKELVWLRLKWTIRRRGARGVRFFGHVLAEPSPEAAALAQFDQDLPAQNFGPVAAVEQNLVRAANLPPTACLRAGMFKPSNLKRLEIIRSEAPFDALRRCVFLGLSCR